MGGAAVTFEWGDEASLAVDAPPSPDGAPVPDAGPAPAAALQARPRTLRPRPPCAGAPLRRELVPGGSALHGCRACAGLLDMRTPA